MRRGRLLGVVLCCSLLAFLTGCASWLERDSTGPASVAERSIGPPTEHPSSDDEGVERTTSLPAPSDAGGQSDRATETILGTGRFVNRDRALSVDTSGEIVLNFVDAPVVDVVDAILGEALGLNYTVDPTVGGMVTLRTNRPLNRTALVPTLESVLRLNGIALVEQNGLFQVVPQANALRGDVVPRVGSVSGRARGFGVQVVSLAHITASEMAGILEPLVRPDTVVRVDLTRNLLLVAGTERERVNVQEIVRIFDVDVLTGMSFQLVRLQAAAPDAIIKELQTVFGDQAEGPLAGVVRFVPISRMNALLVITTNPAYVASAQEWIERLDVGSETNERRLFVYHVENARAADLAAVLSQILGSAPAPERRGQERGEVRPGFVPVEITTELERAVGASTASSDERSPNTDISERSRPRSDTQVVDEPRPSVSDASADGLLLGGAQGVRIIADDNNNALLILATPQEYRQISAALRALDILPLQVLIEATIAEVRLQNELRYGLQWFFQSGDSSATLSVDPFGAVASEFPGLSLLFSSGPDVFVVLNALEAVTTVNVLSSPQLMVLDNRTAELQVGDEVPVATQSAVSIVDPDAPIVNSIEFRNTGVVLRVTPRVNASGLVTLDIEQEVSDVIETTTSGIDSPTIQQRRISSSVVVADGETIALGGLIRDSRDKSRTGIPFLSSLPLIGPLFGQEEEGLDRTELLVLITPRVVRNQDEAAAVTEELRRRLQAVVPIYEERRGPSRGD